MKESVIILSFVKEREKNTYTLANKKTERIN